MARLIVLLCAWLAACGGAGGDPVAPERRVIALPSLALVRSDFIDPAHGTPAAPLAVATPRCTGASVDWQQRLCDSAVAIPAAWPVSNHYATTTPGEFFAWRVSANHEDAWTLEGNSGPPNQSRSVMEMPFNLAHTQGGAFLSLYHASSADAAGKIPYLALSYVRGVQGDGVPRLARWGDNPVVRMTLSIEAPTESAVRVNHLQVWLHFRAADGLRHMLNLTLYKQGALITTAEFRWHWPAVASFYYPGAHLKYLGTTSGCAQTYPAISAGGREQVVALNVESIFRCAHPAVQGVDFLGFEIAVEQAYQAVSAEPNWTRATLRDVSLTINP